MPVRNKAVQKLVDALEGGCAYNTIRDVAYIGPVGPERRTITMDEYKAKYDAAYVTVIDSIDWNRVFIEATRRHRALDHQDTDYGAICEECINEALLAPSWQDWTQHPHAERSRGEE